MCYLILTTLIKNLRAIEQIHWLNLSETGSILFVQILLLQCDFYGLVEDKI